MSARWLTPATNVTELNPYDGDIRPLTLDDYQYFERKYEISGHNLEVSQIARGTHGRYILPIFSSLQRVRGYVARMPWDGAPLWSSGTGTKALTYMHEVGAVQSFYAPIYSYIHPESSALVIVEDQLSAMKAAQAGYSALALLGQPGSPNVRSYSGHDRVREIQATHPRSVIVALDADATEAAFEFVRKWGMAFEKIRVAILERDIKDSMLADIPAILGD